MILNCGPSVLTDIGVSRLLAAEGDISNLVWGQRDAVPLGGTALPEINLVRSPSVIQDCSFDLGVHYWSPA